MANEERKMTLEEYQKKYSRPRNEKAAKIFLFLFAAAIAVIIIFCLFSVVTKVYEMCEKNVVSLWISIPIAVIIFIIIYLVPLIKLKKLKPFITQGVNRDNLKEVQKYNKALRESIADKMIDLHSKTNDVDWYGDKAIGQLAIARHTRDDGALRAALLDIYKSDVKKAAHKMIRKHAVRVGITTALSQNEKVDTIFSVAFNLDLIKNLVYLYGFRPSDSQLVKIYQGVIMDALVAYGCGQITGSIGNAVAKKVGSALSNVPVLGSLVGTAVDSISQGLINATLTTTVGFQTINYLMKEYKLQDVLDDVTLSEDEADVKQLLDSLKKDISDGVKNKKAEPNAA